MTRLFSLPIKQVNEELYAMLIENTEAASRQTEMIKNFLSSQTVVSHCKHFRRMRDAHLFQIASLVKPHSLYE